MKRFGLAVGAAIGFTTLAFSQTGYLVEGEAFQFKGKWVVEKSSDCLGTAMLRVFNGGDTSESADALTVLDISEAGTYHVWTRSQDFENSARPRTFTLTVDNHAMAESGAHGVPGFYWEHVGEVSLDRKQVLMRLSDTGQYYGRCDAILLVKESAVNPNTMTNSEIAHWRRNPVKMEFSTESAPSLGAPRDITSGYTTIASVNNGEIRLSFVKLKEDNVIVCKTDYYASGTWRRYGGTAEDNRLAIISSSQPTTVNYDSFYPSWSNCTASRTLTFDGQQYPVRADGDNTNPFFTGLLAEARVTSVKKESATTLRVTYDCEEAGKLTGLWTLAESGPHASLCLEFTPSKDGSYSFVLHGAKGLSPDAVTGGLMPPMFSSKRLPDTPLMMCSSMMSQCLSAIETQTTAGAVTAFVSADLDTFPSTWGSMDYSPIGFTLMNSRGEMQPVAISPLPGMSDSRMKTGKKTEARFVTGIRNGSWNDALVYVSDNIFGVTDYRHPAGCSATETFENIIKLIKDDNYSGWNATLKGFWDIEADGNVSPTVVQSAPLALVGAATLTYDEDLYEHRALPAIEYTLSRNGYRTRANTPQQLSPMTSQFPTTLYEGINTLTGKLNPWLSDLAIPDGEVRAANGYFSTLQKARQELSAYRMTGDSDRLSRARSLADNFAEQIMSDELPDMTQGSFYNSQMIPDWTPLLDIYDETGDERYLEAAAHGAAHTLAGVRTWPRVADGDMTVHTGGKYDGVTTVWWKGTEQFRLGFPRQEGDAPQHDVEAWSVSPVGLGMEQPATYFVRTAGKNTRPVFMNSWAPRLLELSSATGESVYETYGRNAIIGRGENYPGYYATGYTDITMSQKFPYTGPDVSSIYYHHIPAYMAMIQDWIVTGIESCSDGAVEFTPARQEGFVWFANNIYGGTRGIVNGQEATLYMPQGAVTTDNVNINVLTARSATQFHIMLGNDGNDDAKVNVSLGNVIANRVTGDHILHTDVPARGTKVLSIDADFSDMPTPTPLHDGMQRLETGTAAGTVYLYRIRSPFGWDSLYGFADCSAVEGLSILAECGEESHLSQTWPYEWSFGRRGYDEAANVKITVMIDGKAIKTIELEADGDTQAGIDTITVDVNKRNGIYDLTGRQLKRISTPGVYIVNGELRMVN